MGGFRISWLALFSCLYEKISLIPHTSMLESVFFGTVVFQPSATKDRHNKGENLCTSGEHFTLWAIHCTARTVCGKMYPPIKPGDNNNNTTILITIPSPAFDFIIFHSHKFISETSFKEDFYALVFTHKLNSWAIPNLCSCWKNINSERTV